ncbi:MAG TPA: response regulator [Candidatus Binatia bacterium]|nr:response regulator [Candidatus Binatia bacterium]
MLFAVDDDRPTLALLCDIARASGWVARGFTRLWEVRARLARGTQPALLILDDDLPDGRGGDLARELRADPRTEDMPLLICSGAAPERRVEMRGFVPVVSKPFDLEEIECFLDAAARRLHDGRRRHAALAAGR